MCPVPSTKRVALWCWYHGGPFRGYQSQPVGPTVQDTVIAALRQAGFSRTPVAASRTDLGVHARMQVLSMRVVEDVEPRDVAARLNAVLPPSVGVVMSRPVVDASFHAAWSATGKTYRYRLALADDPAWAPWSWRADVEEGSLREVLSLTVGTHDFAAFHDASSARKPRTIYRVEVHRLGPSLLEVELEGAGFAKYMVRFLVGAAVDVARGEVALETFRTALASGQRQRFTKAPAQGLVLWNVAYPFEVDPFSPEERAAGPLLPPGPPFESVRLTT
ncbi:MAG: tRNA pseudouridine(38-40) synthase TruA [Archangium sp.]|nr:tRNA pseudouridine(38-40) synthase TruA [Archangium sp.]